MRHLLLAIIILAMGAASAAGRMATETYADAVAAEAASNAVIQAKAYTDSTSSGLAIDAKVAAATNGIPERIAGVAATADSASASATAAGAKADEAKAAAIAATNQVAAAVASLAAETAARTAADSTHSAAIAAETAARTAADALLQQQITATAEAVVNAASVEDLQAETAARQAQAEGLHNEIASTAAGLQPRLTPGANISIDGNVISASVSGGADAGSVSNIVNGIVTPIANTIPNNITRDANVAVLVNCRDGTCTNALITLRQASSSRAGLMTAADKIALNSVGGTVTNIVRDLSLGGIWDEQLGIWWTPKMINGALKYCATTNVNMEVTE